MSTKYPFTYLFAALAFAISTWAVPEPVSAEPTIKLAQAKTKRVPRVSRTGEEAKKKERLNSWTIGLAAGRIEGAPLRFASELARVLDDGNDLRVIPMVTRGIFDNMEDLLYLRGVDAAIVYGDVLEFYKKNPSVSNIGRRITFLLGLFPAELHIFVRPEIKSLKDLEGKVVNFNTKGTAAAYSGPLIFGRLGIKVRETFIPHTVAIGKMIKGPEVAAVVFISSKPLAPFIRRKWPEGFHFLPVPYSKPLEEYYLPTTLTAADYPALIPAGQTIQTVAVPAVLAAYDWPADTDRHRRMTRFVDYLFKRFEKLQKDPGYHPKWKDLNLAASVPGWRRFTPMQARLDALKAARASRVDPAYAREQARRAAPNDKAAQERLFKEFMDWAKKRQQ